MMQHNYRVENFAIKTQEHIWTHVWCPRNWHVWKNGLNFNYVWQPASEEKPAEDVQTAPQAEVAPVSWFGNGPTHADLGCDDSFCRVRGGDIPLVEFFPLFLLGFVVGKSPASSSGWHFRDFFWVPYHLSWNAKECKWCNTMIMLKYFEIKTQEHIWTHVWCPWNWHVWKNGLNFNYVLQPASEEKPAEDVQTAPQARVAPVFWFVEQAVCRGKFGTERVPKNIIE